MNIFIKHSPSAFTRHFTPHMTKLPRSKGKQVSNKPVSLLDLYPALVSICGLPANPENEGRDISPELENLNTL